LPATVSGKNGGMPSCLVVQHVPPEGPYAIGPALESAGVDVDVRAVFAGEDLPSDLTDIDGLVVMGGPMSALSDEGFPSRRGELELLAEGLDRGLPMLGVCLGAQLLALAGGGAVYPGPTGPEIGWGPVALTAEAEDDPLLGGLPEQLTVLHWHGDTFEPPVGAIRLATNGRYPNQAFRSGSRAWGLQFHLEVDGSAVAAFVDAFGAEAARAGSPPRSILAGTAPALKILEPHRRRVLARFAQLVAAHDRSQVSDRA
jgi:GMP synthase-like glutamine amidotransferase